MSHNLTDADLLKQDTATAKHIVATTNWRAIDQALMTMFNVSDQADDFLTKALVEMMSTFAFTDKEDAERAIELIKWFTPLLAKHLAKGDAIDYSWFSDLYVLEYHAGLDYRKALQENMEYFSYLANKTNNALNVTSVLLTASITAIYNSEIKGW